MAPVAMTDIVSAAVPTPDMPQTASLIAERPLRRSPFREILASTGTPGTRTVTWLPVPAGSHVRVNRPLPQAPVHLLLSILLRGRDPPAKR